MTFRITLSAIAICLMATLGAQEEVIIKPLPNVPVNYHLVLNADANHKGGGKLGTLVLEQDFQLLLTQKENEVPELVITPFRTIHKIEGFGFVFSFDSKSIPEGNTPILKKFRTHWGKPFHIPLTTDMQYIREHSDIHPYLDEEQMADYKQFVNAVLDYMKNGEHYKLGQELWTYSENNEEQKIHGEAKVAQITADQVVLKAVIHGMLNNAGQAGTQIVVNGEAESIIKRANALLRDGNGHINIKISSKDKDYIVYIGEGDIEITATLKLTASKA